jgi:surfeit locus 1 family protein
LIAALAGRRFRPSWPATVLTILGVVLFARLGLWQLHRADEKQALLAQYAAGQHSLIDLTVADAPTLPRYQRVRVRGHYDPAHQVLLDNMPWQNGRPGYRVVTALELEQGGWALVDRGWVPMGATRADIPDTTVGADARELTGRFTTLPRAGITLDVGDTGPPAAWPKVLAFPQHATLESVLGRKLIDGLVLLDPDQPDGYQRAWQEQVQTTFGPGRHIAYAVQWFAFALAALVLYVAASLEREKK